MSVPSTLKNAKIRDELVAETIALLKAGEEVTFGGIGKFSILNKPARTGRNPATGAAVEIPAKKVVKFQMSKNLKDALNG